MKRISTILTLFIATWIFIPKVFAINYMTVGKTNVEIGENFDVIINAENVASWNIKITSNDNANCADEKSGTSTAENPNLNHTITCSATNEGTATITLTGSMTTVGDEENPDGITVELNESIDVTVKKQDEPRGLSKLQVTGGSLSPLFDSNNIENTGYTITLDSSETTSFKIDATAKTETDIINPTRENNTEYESINLDNIIFVTSGNNDTMLIEINVGEGERLVKYKITVVKPPKVEIEPPELLTLTVGGENIPLVKDLYTYSITLDESNLEKDGSYKVNATLKDDTNYMFDEFLTPPKEISGKEFTLTIVPKDPTLGMKSVTYKISVKINIIEPVTVPSKTTVKKNPTDNQENPQTGSTPAYIVGIMLIASLAASLYLYKKNINGYN